MAIEHLQTDHGFDNAGANCVSPAGTSFLVAIYSGWAAATAMTWNGDALTSAYSVDGRNAIFYLADPDIGNFAFAHDGSTNGCTWACYWLNGINKTNPIGSQGTEAAGWGGAIGTVTCTDAKAKEFLVAGVANYWDDNGTAISGTNLTNDHLGGNAAGHASSVAHVTLVDVAGYIYTVAAHPNGVDDWAQTSWTSFKPKGLANSVIII